VEYASCNPPVRLRTDEVPVEVFHAVVVCAARPSTAYYGQDCVHYQHPIEIQLFQLFPNLSSREQSTKCRAAQFFKASFSEVTAVQILECPPFTVIFNESTAYHTLGFAQLWLRIFWRPGCKRRLRQLGNTRSHEISEKHRVRFQARLLPRDIKEFAAQLGVFDLAKY